MKANDLVNSMKQEVICLVIFFTHKYENNIEKLEKIYHNRFDNIFYLMPFYQGREPNVIPVYENSYNFQGSFAQGLKSFYDERFTHYVFIADDLILNSMINQDNICNLLNLELSSAYFKDVFTIHNINWCWSHVLPAVYILSNSRGVQYKDEVPPVDEAVKIFNMHGLDVSNLNINNETKQMLLEYHIKSQSYDVVEPNTLIQYFLRSEETKIPYPLVGGYSDFSIIPAKSIKKFCHLCGVFASIRLFVEIAVPTSLLLTCEDIIFEKKEFQGLEIWDGYELDKIGVECGLSIENLFSKYHSKLYVHPIKLSKWYM
jgi:hypothetical protein